MARTKVRNYESREVWQERIIAYLKEHKEKYIRLVLQTLGYETTDELRDAEYNQNRFGLDCGWVKLVPKNKEMAREWKLDNDNIPAAIYDVANTIYSTQSTTIKNIIMDAVVSDMNIEDIFCIVVVYD